MNAYRRWKQKRAQEAARARLNALWPYVPPEDVPAPIAVGDACGHIWMAFRSCCGEFGIRLQDDPHGGYWIREIPVTMPGHPLLGSHIWSVPFIEALSAARDATKLEVWPS